MSPVKFVPFFARDAVYFLAGFNFKLYSLKMFPDQTLSRSFPLTFFAKIVTRGNAVQIFLNFPAKRLSIYRKKKLSHLLIS